MYNVDFSYLNTRWLTDCNSLIDEMRKRAIANSKQIVINYAFCKCMVCTDQELHVGNSDYHEFSFEFKVNYHTE